MLSKITKLISKKNKSKIICLTAYSKNIAEELDNYADLILVGGWMNYREQNLLLVRISDNEIRAFDNSCPHQGNRDRWEYDGSSFTCGHHSNSYSNSCTGSLICFDTNIENGILTISFN